MSEKMDKINKYITEKFVDISDYQTCLKNISELRSFLIGIKYSFKMEDIVYLLKNNSSFNNCVKKLFDTYEKEITSGNIEKISKNAFVKNILYRYCMVNNIEIHEDLEITDDIGYGSDYDAVKAYLKDISQFKLMTFEEEQELAKKYRAGDDDAKEEFINRNLRMVASRARHYVGRGLSYEDLIGFGNFGLLKAVDKFDPEYGFRFSTYAWPNVDQAIERALQEHSKHIRIPVYLHDISKKYFDAYEYLYKKNRHEPTAKEISEMIKVPLSVVEKFRLAISIKTVSINTVINEDGDTEISDLVADPNTDVEQKALNNLTYEALHKIIKTNKAGLTKRQLAVLKYRFGLYDGKEHTLEEVANLMYDEDKSGDKPVTRESVRQSEVRLLRKLNRPWVSRNINPNIEENDEVIVNETLRDMLSDYSKEEICNIILQLDIKERMFLVRIFGTSLNQVFDQTLDVNGRIEFFGKLLPKMKRRLALSRLKKVDTDKEKINSEQRMSELFKEATKEKQEEDKKIERNMSKDLFFTRRETAFLNKIEKNIKPEDFIRLVEIIQLIKNIQEYKKISIVGLTVLLLSMGYVNSKHYGNIEIANILSIDFESVKYLQNSIIQDYHNIHIKLDEITGKKLQPEESHVLKKVRP